MATIKDVAAAAGVQPATVSYVLNGTGSVSAATKARVLAAAAALNYQPSHAARSLQRQQTKTLGVLVPADRDPAAWGLIVNGLLDTASAQRYELLISAVTAARPLGAALAELGPSRRVDGLVLLDVVPEDGVEVAAVSLPWVCANPAADQLGVAIDNEAGMIEAVAHLIGLGFERIALITPPLEWAVAEQQDRGYRAALDEAGLDFDPTLLVEGGTTEADGYAAAAELLGRPERPAAIIAGVAALTFGTLHAAHDFGPRRRPRPGGAERRRPACRRPHRAAADGAAAALLRAGPAAGGAAAHTPGRRVAR